MLNRRKLSVTGPKTTLGSAPKPAAALCAFARACLPTITVLYSSTLEAPASAVSVILGVSMKSTPPNVPMLPVRTAFPSWRIWGHF